MHVRAVATGRIAVGLALAAAAAVAVGAAPVGAATFPGSTGVVAFSQFDEDNPGAQIMTVNPTTSATKDVSKTHYGDDEPDFSPDGKTILFRNDGDIWTMTEQGASRRDLTPGSHGSYDTPSWSPNGKEIAFSDNGQVATMKADGTGITVLTTKDGETPDWSPDGTEIAFVSHNDPGDISHLFVMRPNGTHKVDLSAVTDPSDAYYDQDPSWSPDSSQLAVDSDRPSVGDDIGPIQAFSIARDGSTATQLTAVSDNVDGQVFSPDGQAIAYTANDNGTNQVFVQTVGSFGSFRPVTNGPDTAIGTDESWQSH